jgi:23S rRNA (cytidine1920-2'-O)/16S rRNA (cytidine1409-2'-O)-methyltransferase
MVGAKAGAADGVRGGTRKTRVDQRVLELGLEESRARAQARILAGDVRWGDRVLDKPGTLIPAGTPLELRARSPFVSRGGEKLDGALDALGVDPAGLRCADAGASTGGFTDCLLQRGAAEVLAIDVGYGQLAARLRADPRVRVRERTNLRYFELEPGVAPFDLVTADLSFISLRLVLERLVALVRPGGRLLCLVKPQFELERGQVGKGGVVRDPALRARAVQLVREAAEALGLEPQAEVDSPLAGPRGNLERFLLLRCPPDPRDPAQGGRNPEARATILAPGRFNRCP